jgi:hypothetical protein
MRTNKELLKVLLDNIDEPFPSGLCGLAFRLKHILIIIFFYESSNFSWWKRD